MSVKLTQMPKRAEAQVDRQKDFIKWMIHKVQSVCWQNPYVLIDASDRIL